MLRLFKLLLGYGLLTLALPLWAAVPVADGIGQISPGASRANLQVERLDAARTRVRLVRPEILKREHWADYRMLQSFGIEGEALVPAEGRPTVPQVTRLYQIPPLGGVRLEVGALEFDLLENVDALPLHLEAAAFGQMQRDSRIYSTDGWYPAEVAVLSAPAILRELRVAQLTLYPVQVNPVTRQVRLYRTIDAQIVATAEPGDNEIRNPRPLSASFLPVYRQMVANLDETSLDALGIRRTPGSYLILCANDATVLPFVDSLFVWKTRKGFRTVVDARAAWSTTAMQSAIINAYNTYDPPLEFVCIIGDPQAPFGLPTDFLSYDHGFALCAGGDELEDIGVGRLSGVDGSQMATISAKILGYERNPWMGTTAAPDTGWFRRAFLYAGVNIDVASNLTLMQWAAQQFRAWSGVQDPNVQVVDGHVDDNLVISQFNSGVSFFLWRGSLVGEMEPSLAGQTNPGWRLPICLCVTCAANNFQNGLGIAESYLVAGSASMPRGGVASVGTATTTTYAPQNVTFTGGLIFALINQGVEHLGNGIAAGKAWLALAFGLYDANTENFSRWNNLMGDPGLSVWTGVPTEIEGLHPAVLSVGARSVTVTVRRSADHIPVSDALVALWKRSPDSTWVRGLTDAEGRVDLPVNVRAGGTMMLTVTKRNHKPYLADLPCTAATMMPMLSTWALDDDNAGGTNGNGNGALNPGEVLDLAVYVRNFGSTAPATTVSATLSSDNPHVTVLSGEAQYANLAAGDSALGSLPFRLSVSPQMQHRESVLLTLAIATDAGQTQGVIPLACTAGALDYLAQQLSGALEPGVERTLRLTVINNGLLALDGVTGRLQSRSPFMQVTDEAGVFGDILPGAQATTQSADVFGVRADPLAYRGHQAPMFVVTTAADGKIDTVRFTLTAGTAAASDPTGPDAFGYFAYDNSDVSYEHHPSFNYLNIAGGLGTNLNLQDGGERNDYMMPPTATARPLPFGFKFYGTVYDTITVCSNGWMAFGNQAWNDNFRNYPIPAMQAPQAMIAPYWQDLCTSGAGLGVWLYHQPDSHRVIVQWKAAPLNSFGFCGNFALDFEVILYDTTFHPTVDGNGKVLVQYQTVTMATTDLAHEIPGCGVGIQDVRGTTGLAIYNHPNYQPGAAPIENGRAILFSTERRFLCGAVSGLVRDAETLLPLPGANVSIDGQNSHAISGADGRYLIENVLIGNQTVRSQRYRCNDATAGVIVCLDSVSEVNFTMLRPEMALSPAELADSIGGLPETTSFEILNTGSGPLDYRIDILLGAGETYSPWDSVGGIAVTASTDDWLIQGCECGGDFWWVTGGGGPGGQNVVYKFDLAGQLAGSIPQPSTTSTGWFDLAWDGARLYGSDGTSIIGIDPLGNVVDEIPSPLTPSRALAYDPVTDHFWVADFTQDIYELDRDGNYGEPYPNGGTGELAITGLAWNPADPEGYKLYIFSQNGPGLQRVSRLNPVTRHMQTVIDLPAAAGDRAGGCTITGGWNCTRLVFGGIVQNSAGDRMEIRQMADNTAWISVAPMAYTVPAASAREIEVRFDPETLRDGSYHVNLHVTSMVYDTTLILPVALTVHRAQGGVPAACSPLPQQYSLYQNAPNPFNPTTEIRFNLPVTTYVELKIFNTLGQLITTLVSEARSAGAYTVQWDGKNSKGLTVSTGMYIYQLRAGSFTDARKMLLMK